VELQLQLTEPMRACQTALLDLIDACIKELKRCNRLVCGCHILCHCHSLFIMWTFCVVITRDGGIVCKILAYCAEQFWLLCAQFVANYAYRLLGYLLHCIYYTVDVWTRK